MTRLLEVVLLFVLCWEAMSSRSTCSNSSLLCYVTLEYPDHFAVHHNTLLVGLRNEIKQLTLDLEVLQQVNSFDVEKNATCHNDDRNKVTDCHNYHRSIIFPSGNQMIAGDSMDVPANQTFIACGTNFLRPNCQYRMISDLSLVKKQASTGFCPEQADIGTAFVEFNTTLWVGTVVKDHGADGVLSQSRQPFNGKIFHSTVIDSNYWLKTSSFVDMYEKGEYVYAFFREITVELSPNAVRSRVARICKTDAGQPSTHQRTYQTYIKSSIRCGVQGASSEDRYQDVPFYYDDLYDTTLLKSGSYRQSSRDRPMQLYGVFQNSGNGPVGSVVCVYTLDHMNNDVTRVFRGDYLRRVTSTSTWQRANNNDPFSCENGRSVDEAENDIIMYNDVQQANPNAYPLYIKEGQRFHKIVVGQVTALDGIVYEVMFIAVEDKAGNYSINKVSYVEARAGQRSVEHHVLKLNQSDRRINHMYYHQQDGGMDVIYISTPNRLYRMNPYQCSAHQSCGSCVASMDPYCAYDTALGACVGINSANQNVALQNVTHGVADCPIVVATEAIPTPSSNLIVSSSSSALLPSSSSVLTVPPLPTAESLQASNRSDQGMWGWLGIGLGVGIIIGLVAGVFLLFAWQRRLGFLRYCSEDSMDSPCGDIPSKGACGYDEEYKKTPANLENGMVNGDVYLKGKTDYPLNVANGTYTLPNGKTENFNHSTKGNNYISHDPKQPLKCDHSNASNGTKPNQSLHERRTSHPAMTLKMQQMDESPQRFRSHSIQHHPTAVSRMVPVTSGAVSNREMARYGSNYSLDPETSKPTLTPTHKRNVYFDTKRDSVDLDQCLQKSTDC